MGLVGCEQCFCLRKDKKAIIGGEDGGKPVGKEGSPDCRGQMENNFKSIREWKCGRRNLGTCVGWGLKRLGQKIPSAEGQQGRRREGRQDWAHRAEVRSEAPHWLGSSQRERIKDGAPTDLVSSQHARLRGASSKGKNKKEWVLLSFRTGIQRPF